MSRKHGRGGRKRVGKKTARVNFFDRVDLAQKLQSERLIIFIRNMMRRKRTVLLAVRGEINADRRYQTFDRPRWT